LALEHGSHIFSSGALEVVEAGNGLDLVGNIVVFEEVGEDPAAAEGVGLKGHENQDRWGERVVSALEVEVEGREERSWEVHCAV
jgi:hypothetical protein